MPHGKDFEHVEYFNKDFESSISSGDDFVADDKQLVTPKRKRKRVLDSSDEESDKENGAREFQRVASTKKRKTVNEISNEKSSSLNEKESCASGNEVSSVGVSSRRFKRSLNRRKQVSSKFNDLG